ncbi:hypothetical protein D3C73_1656130 [compost metagenome]
MRQGAAHPEVGAGGGQHQVVRARGATGEQGEAKQGGIPFHGHGFISHQIILYRYNVGIEVV